MALLVTCDCGHRLEAGDDQAGTQVPCPGCGRSLRLPEPYNPLSTAKYVQSAQESVPTAETARARPAGPTCEACGGSGVCRYCHGAARLKKPLLDRITGGIAGAVAGVVGFLGGALGADADPKKFKTKSEKRRAGACPGCEGSGTCYSCEGSGRAPPA